MRITDLPEVETPDAERRVQEWEQRCSVSHAGHFVPMRPPSAAFHRLTVPLNEARIAVASSGGVYSADQEPFDMLSRSGDDSFRWIPVDTPPEQVRFSDDHYDHSDADSDPNCMFPMQRLRELAEEGVIGSAAPRHIGFMGFIPDPSRFVTEVVPEMIAGLEADAVDAVLFSPGCPMCHRSVALAQNLVEEAGIATVSVSLSPALTLGHGVPRALAVRFPFGSCFGVRGDVWTQRAIVKALLRWLLEAAEPNRLRRLPYSWSNRAVPEDQEDCEEGSCFVPRPVEARTVA